MHEQHPDDDMAQLGERLTTRVGGKWSPNKVTKARAVPTTSSGDLVDQVLSREMIADRASLWDAIEALNLRDLVDRSSFIRHYCALDGEEPAVLMTARQRFKEWRDERPDRSSIYCDVLTIWEESPRDGIEEMVQQVAEKIPGAWDAPASTRFLAVPSTGWVSSWSMSFVPRAGRKTGKNCGRNWNAVT